MRIAIFGATGATGQLIVEQALERGHLVTAFARDPRSLAGFGERIRVVQGDVQQPDRVAEAVRGQDAVLFAVGVRRGSPPGTVLSSGTRNVVEAMRANGVRRLIVQSGIVVSGSRARMRPLAWVISALFRLNNPALYREKDQQEEIVRATDLDWTLVRPPLIVQGPRTGRYRAGDDFPPPLPAKIRYADVADFMLEELERGTFIRRAPVVVGT